MVESVIKEPVVPINPQQESESAELNTENINSEANGEESKKHALDDESSNHVNKKFKRVIFYQLLKIL